MSRPRHYWYGTVNKMVKRYPYLKEDNSIQAGIFLNAISRALDEIRNLQDGDDRVKAIQAICLNKTDTVESMSLKIHFCERIIQGWVNSFINMVGRYAGF